MFLRRLRGLRAQLLLWTIVPLAVVLVILSLAGITRHRQAMTQLVADRDRGLVWAEANRLGREIEGRATALADAAATTDLAAAPGRLGELAHSRPGFPGGLALLSADGGVVSATEGSAAWVMSDEARGVAARTAALGSRQYEDLFETAGRTLLLIGVPIAAGRVLVGAVPTDSLVVAETGVQAEAAAHGALFIIDAAGRPVHRHNPAGLAVDVAALAELPQAPAADAGVTGLRTRTQDLLVAYALVQPPGWRLVIAEDVRHVGSLGVSVVEVLPLLLLFVALLGMVAVSFGVINVVRPLQELDRRAQRVAWGDFDAVKQPVGGVQEMEDLRATLAQMAERIRAYQAGMRDYLSAVTQAQEAERSRLAHELHDETVQALIALKQRATMARKALASDPGRAGERLDELTALIDRELVGLRRLIGDLRPIYLEDLGFVPALDTLVRQMEEQHGLMATLAIEGETVRLAPDLELAAFRIVQQALTNVAAHAEARSVFVTVTFAADGLALTVRDDGRGFVPPDQPADLARDGHFGLMGMAERATLYGGHLRVASAPGQGATIAAWLPIR